MKRAKVVAIRPEVVTLNAAQESGIAGVKEQIDRTHALILGAESWLRNWPDDVQLTKEDFTTVLLLLDMAADELGDYKCLYRIRDGKFD